MKRDGTLLIFFNLLNKSTVPSLIYEQFLMTGSCSGPRLRAVFYDGVMLRTPTPKKRALITTTRFVLRLTWPSFSRKTTRKLQCKTALPKQQKLKKKHYKTKLFLLGPRHRHLNTAKKAADFGSLCSCTLFGVFARHKISSHPEKIKALTMHCCRMTIRFLSSSEKMSSRLATA